MEKKIKLVVSDLDGTILQKEESELSEQFISLIRQLKAKNISFCAATGRQYDNVYRLFQPVCEEIYYICENGGVLAKGSELYSVKEMPKQLGENIIKVIEETPECEVLLSGLHTSYILPYNKAYLFHLQHVLKNNCTTIQNFSEVTEPYIKISLYKESGVDDVLDYFIKRFADKAQIRAAKSGDCWIDFIYSDINKGAALMELCSILNIEKEACIAFGDNDNDLHMFDIAGTSYAMSHSAQHIKQSANFVCERVEDIIKSI